MIRKTVWVVFMLSLSLVLYTLISTRTQTGTDVIMGGETGAFIRADSVSFADVKTTPSPEPTVDIWPKLTQDDFSDKEELRLVNNKNLLASAFEPEVERIAITKYQMFSSKFISHLNDFLQLLIDQGYTPYIAASYRSYSWQSQLFNTKASQIAYEMSGGKNVDYTDPIYQDAAKQAESITMKAGASEHQLGLAVDILDRERTRLIYENMDQEFFAFVDAHCAEYGFIKRYPTRKMLLTGWDEPWHYRYVGQEVATFIMEQGISYEEFYAHYFPDFSY